MDATSYPVSYDFIFRSMFLQLAPDLCDGQRIPPSPNAIPKQGIPLDSIEVSREISSVTVKYPPWQASLTCGCFLTIPISKR